VGRAMVKQNRANYELATARLNNSTITAPASGTIVSKNVAVGEIVAGPLGGATFSAPTFMAEIADLGDLEVIVDVDEVDIGKIQVGQQAAISVDAFPEKYYQGVVKEIAFMTSSRREVGITYRVKARITNPDRALKLGMTANLDFLLGKKEQVLTVPKSAVITKATPSSCSRSMTARCHAKPLPPALKVMSLPPSPRDCSRRKGGHRRQNRIRGCRGMVAFRTGGHSG